MTNTKIQIEIMLYFMRNGELCALLGRYGYMTESSSCSLESRKGHYRPTACGEVVDTSLGSLLSILQENLGSEVISDLVPFVSEARIAQHPTKTRFVVNIPSKIVEKMKLPYYSGCLRPINAVEVFDIVEVPTNNGSWIFNRIPVTAGEDWKDFILKGFELLSSCK